VQHAKGLECVTTSEAWRKITWPFELLSRVISPDLAPQQGIRAWANFFLGGLHYARSRALRSANKAGHTQDTGLQDAMASIKLLDAAAQQASAAGVYSCAYWAKTTVVLILMNMKQFKVAYDTLAALSTTRVEHWEGIDFVALGSDKVSDGKHFYGQMMHEWAVLLLGLGEVDRAMVCFETRALALELTAEQTSQMSILNYLDSVTRDEVSRAHLRWGSRFRQLVGLCE